MKAQKKLTKSSNYLETLKKAKFAASLKTLKAFVNERF